MKTYYKSGRTEKRLSPLRAKRSTPKHTCAAITTIVFGLAVTTGHASAQTQYERQNQGPRLAPWEQPDTNVRRQSTGSPSIESSNLPIDAEALTSSYERIRQNPGWVAVEDQVGDQTDRIGDLEDLLDQMDIASSWQEEAPIVGDWDAGTTVASATWEPAISTQTSDFTQTRQVTKHFQRTVTIYESIAATGERRVKDSYTETQTVNETQSRVIDVARSPAGGPDGWSAYSATSAAYACGTYSPSPSTVDSGTFFTQTRTCSQDQERNIYYLTSGSVINQRAENQTVSITQSQLGYGTRIRTTWQQAGRWPTAAELNDPNISRYTAPIYDTMRRPEGDTCSPAGSKMIHEQIVGGFGSYTLYECRN